MTDPESGALTGFRVLDMSRILAGPWAGQMLADLGADVIKVERPGQGDDTRHWGPPFFEDDSEGGHERVAAYFHGANRGKRSIAVDITSEQGQELIRGLVAESDVLIENYKVDGLKKYGLDYDSLKAVNPRLVYCSITGFGQTGPYRERAGYDFMIQGMGGLMSVTGEAEGMPMKTGVALVDVMTGLYASNAIQAALLYRYSSGKGQYIDMSLLDVQVATMANQAMNYLTTGVSPGRLGNSHPNIVPYQAFPTQDSHIILAVGNDGQFERFCAVAGCQHLFKDERYQTNQSRVANRKTLIPILNDILVQKTSDWWLSSFEKVSVPCGPINTLEQVFSDKQVNARELQRTLHHPTLGDLPTVANPIRFSETEIKYDRASPSLGDSTVEILKSDLGMSDDDIGKLQQIGVVE